MNKTILLVDYDQKSLDEIQQFFADEHFTVLTAHDGTQALEMFDTKSPDLVLTSALLPKLNGFELCKKITSGEHGEIRPVILFSGIYKAEKYRKEAIIGCGAVDFLEKPLAKWQMLKVIKSLFSEIPYEQSVRQFQTNEATILLEIESPPKASVAQEAIADDLLQVEALLEGDDKGFERNSTYGSELVSPEEEDEVGAALDAVRIDLDLETKLRDQQIAQVIEAELLRDGQNVLEFEATMGLENLSSKISNEGPEIIELDSDAGSPGNNQDASEVNTVSLTMGREPETGDVAAPTFALSFPRPRSWIPFLIIMVGLLVIFLFLLQGK